MVADERSEHITLAVLQLLAPLVLLARLALALSLSLSLALPPATALASDGPWGFRARAVLSGASECRTGSGPSSWPRSDSCSPGGRWATGPLLEATIRWNAATVEIDDFRASAPTIDLYPLALGLGLGFRF